MEEISASELSANKSGGFRAILFAGLTAGVLDLTAAFVVTAFRSGKYEQMLQSIASGWLGKPSFEGGTTTAALGFLTHFGIAFVWTIIFYAASRRIKFLTAQPVISGIIYGIIVYTLMYHVIVSLSAAPFTMPHSPEMIALNVSIHIFCIGLPIALIVRRFAK